MAVSPSNPLGADQASASTSRRQSPASAPGGVDVESINSTDVRHACVVIPVLTGTIPIASRRLHGVLRTVSKRGMRIDLQGGACLREGDQLAVGVMMPDGESQFTALIVTKLDSSEMGEVVVQGVYGGPLLAVLSGGLHSPRLNASLDSEFPVKETTLRRLSEAGILRCVLIDRIHVCPQCGALPAYRWGCECCRSVRTISDEMIHHYACAYVGPARQFRDGSSLRCPKCNATRLIVGSDFEYLQGKYHCEDCDWSGTELAHLARCMRCHAEFTPRQAAVRDVVGYRARRLEVDDLRSGPIG